MSNLLNSRKETLGYVPYMCVTMSYQTAKCEVNNLDTFSLLDVDVYFYNIFQYDLHILQCPDFKYAYSVMNFDKCPSIHETIH